MNTLISKLEQINTSINAQIQGLLQQARTNALQLVQEATKEFFEKHSDVVEHIFWTQYTPHFNDGEACEFRVEDVRITLKNDPNWCEYEGSYLYDKKELEELKLHTELKVLWDKDRLAGANAYRQYCIEQKGYDPYTEKRYFYKTVSTQEQLEAWEPPHHNIEEIYDFAKHINSELYADFYEIKNLILSIDEDVMEHLFGNHVKIIVSEQGIEAEDYEHD